MSNQENIWDKLPKGFTVLAPMEGVTDKVFRGVIAKAGRPDLFFTEFTNVTSFASEKGRHDALERLEVAPFDKPIIAQIWGKNPEHFASLASALEELGFDGCDINMGCPDRHVNKAGGGAAMIRTSELAVECIKEAKANTNLPVSVKTRLGFTYLDERHDWLKLLLEQDLTNLTVHLRTRKEMSKVAAHYELIPEILELRDTIAPNTKITINGDIKDLKHIHELQAQYPGVDGWMIGRGVFQNPYCFTDHEPTTEELLSLLQYHLDLFDARAKELEEKGSRYPYEPMKHFFKVYISNFPGASDLRTKLMNCKSTDEVRQVLKESV